MNKKNYIIPQVEAFEMEIQRPLAASQIQTTVNDPLEEVNAEDALAREYFGLGE